MGVDIGPVTSGDGFESGLLDFEGAREAENLVNRFSEMVGYSPVEIDDDFGIEDARRAIEAFRYMLDHFYPKREHAKTLKGRMQAGIEEKGLGRWFYDHGPEIIGNLEMSADNIDSGAWKRLDKGKGGGLMAGLDLKTAGIIGALVLGAAYLASE